MRENPISRPVKSNWPGPIRPYPHAMPAAGQRHSQLQGPRYFVPPLRASHRPPSLPWPGNLVARHGTPAEERTGSTEPALCGRRVKGRERKKKSMSAAQDWHMSNPQKCFFSPRGEHNVASTFHCAFFQDRARKTTINCRAASPGGRPSLGPGPANVNQASADSSFAPILLSSETQSKGGEEGRVGRSAGRRPHMPGPLTEDCAGKGCSCRCRGIIYYYCVARLGRPRPTASPCC